jgi:hypothetical protein
LCDANKKAGLQWGCLHHRNAFGSPTRRDGSWASTFFRRYRTIPFRPSPRQSRVNPARRAIRSTLDREHCQRSASSIRVFLLCHCPATGGNDLPGQVPAGLAPLEPMPPLQGRDFEKGERVLRFVVPQACAWGYMMPPLRGWVLEKEENRCHGAMWMSLKMAGQLRDEAPMAYKDIRSVMRAQQELTRIVRRLRPVLCYKGG